MKPTLSLGLLAAALLAPPAPAELKLPQKSPAEKIAHDIGTSTVTLAYHRPAVRGRAVWGDLVPFGKPWRLGANEVTTIAFTHPARVAGKDVPAGKFALLAIPGKERWTLILNKEADQWGAYFYKPEQDLVRFDVPVHSGASVEWMTFTLTPTSPSGTRVDFAWEKVRFSFPIEVDVDGIAWKAIETELAATKGKPEEWATTLQAARFALEKETRLDEAMVWVDRSLALKESFWNDELKARLLHRAGRTAEAVALIEKAKVLAKGKAPDEYVDGLDRTLAEWRK